MMRAVLLLGFVLGCGSPVAPSARAYVVDHRWVVFVDEAVCFQLDPFQVPDLDEVAEAIAACEARQP
jgi:hypothetical protein